MMEYAILLLTFVAAFGLLASALALLFYRGQSGAAPLRGSGTANGRAGRRKWGAVASSDWATESIGAAAASIRKTPVTQNAAKGTSGLQQRMASAGDPATIPR